MSDFIPNSFQVPNVLIDELLSTMGAADLKCYLLIIRKTVGWQKQIDRISITQFMKITGLSNRAVITACSNLERVGLINVLKDAKGNKSYGLVRSPHEKSSPHEESSRGEKSSLAVAHEESSPREQTSLAQSAQPMNLVHGASERGSRSASEKSSHTKDTLTKHTIQKESITPTRKTKTLIAEDFSISPAVREWADEHGHTNLKAHLESFIDKARSKAYQYVDWDAAFREAIRKNWASIGQQPTSHRQATAIDQTSQRQTESPSPQRQRVSLFAGIEQIRFDQLRALDPSITQLYVREHAKRQNLDVLVLMNQMVSELQGQAIAVPQQALA